jgi:integrase
LQAGCEETSPQNTQPAHKFGTQEYLLQAELAIQKLLETVKGNGTTKATQDKCRTVLNQIANHVNIFDTTVVRQYIAELKRTDTRIYIRQNKPIDKPISNGTKRNMSYAYATFCKENNTQFRKPKYHYEPPTIQIPRNEDINAIINNASKEAITCFKIMKETAIEATELHNTDLTMIDTSKPNAVLTVNGVKQHNNGIYYLSTGTSDMLRQLIKWRKDKKHKHNLIAPMHKNPEEYPFPTQNCLNDSWVRARRQASKKLAKPELENIELKDLRNFAGAVHYLTMGRDILETKKFMRHKKLEQTENYLKGIKDFALTSNKIGRTVSTPEEAMELILQGFKEEAVFYQGTPNKKHILTKLTF